MKYTKFILVCILFSILFSSIVYAEIKPINYKSDIKQSLSENEILFKLDSRRYKKATLFNLPFDNKMRSDKPEFYKDGQYYEQGINSSDYHGTCSEAAEATVMNRIFKTNAYTENNLLAFSSLIKQCAVGTGDKYYDGGQSPIQVMTVLNSIGNLTGDKVESFYLVDEYLPNPQSVADLLEEGCQVIMSVDSYILWDWTLEEAQAMGVSEYLISNHWIVMTEPTYDTNHKLNGFYIVDSSGYGAKHVTLQKYNNMVYGPQGTTIPYPACVIIKRKAVEVNPDGVYTNPEDVEDVVSETYNSIQEDTKDTEMDGSHVVSNNGIEHMVESGGIKMPTFMH